MDEKDIAQATLCEGSPRMGEIYQHYKNGGLYTVVARAVKEDTCEPLVVYQSNANGTIWARTLANWSETVQLREIRVPRFIRVTR